MRVKHESTVFQSIAFTYASGGFRFGKLKDQKEIPERNEDPTFALMGEPNGALLTDCVYYMHSFSRSLDKTTSSSAPPIPPLSLSHTPPPPASHHAVYFLNY